MSNLHRPLNVDRREIRILELFPGLFDAILTCKLSYTTLEEPGPVPYEALSYVWGNPEFTEPIVLNGHPFMVTKNLSTALRHLRPHAGQSPRTIWVDAICINQDDVAERNHQVTLMKDIYSHCTADLAWLGPDSSSKIDTAQQRVNLALGLELLRTLIVKDDATLSSLRSDYENHEFRMNRRRKDNGKDNFLLHYQQQRTLDAVLREAPLWSRIWIMQELALAPRVILVAGSDKMEWDGVARFLGDAPYVDAFHLPWSHGMVRRATQYTFERAQIVQQQRELARDCAEGRAVSTLMDVLGRFKFADATDPRDKIYGLLGLVSEKHAVKVDYERPWHLVFADLCLYFIESSRNLDIICQNPWTTIPAAPNTTELPTWVADFTNKNFSGLDDGFSALLFAQRGIFQAGSETCRAPCQTFDNGGTLQATATFIGMVGQILQDDYDVSDDVQSRSALQARAWSDGWFARAPRKWMELYFGERLLSTCKNEERIVKYAHSSEPAFDAFWRTLVMDCKAFPIERLSRDEIASDGRVFRDLLNYDLDQIRMGYIHSFDKEYDQEKDHLYTQRRDELSKLQEQLVCERMWERNFVHWTFTISQNSLYCMLKRGAKTGDILALLDGGKVPVVLRRVDADSSRFKFMGTAYVHGFMDGEAKLAVDVGRLTKTQVHLV